jgi:hypothetical protein
LPQDAVVSLRVRIEQLTRQDFHLLDCGLVGRSRFQTPRALRSVKKVGTWQGGHLDVGGRSSRATAKLADISGYPEPELLGKSIPVVGLSVDALRQRAGGNGGRSQTADP